MTNDFYGLAMSRTNQARISSAGKWLRRSAMTVMAILSLLSLRTYINPPELNIEATTQRTVNEHDQIGAFASDFVELWLTSTDSTASALAPFIDMKMAGPPPSRVVAAATEARARKAAVIYRATVGEVDSYAVTVTMMERQIPTAVPRRKFYRMPVTVWLTLEAWVYPTAWNLLNAVIARGSATDATAMWWLGVMGSGAPVFWSHGGQNLAGPSTVAVNRWTHLAATFDGATKRLFVDGVQVKEVGGLGPLVYPNQSVPVTIGAESSATGAGAFFTGMIDEVGTYRLALTANEIHAIAAADRAGKDVASPYLVADSPLPPAVLSAPYHQQLNTVLGSPPVTFALGGGQLPPGVDLSSSGTVSGQPSAAGTFGFTVRATDASQRFSERLYVLAVQAPT